MHQCNSCEALKELKSLIISLTEEWVFISTVYDNYRDVCKDTISWMHDPEKEIGFVDRGSHYNVNQMEVSTDAYTNLA